VDGVIFTFDFDMANNTGFSFVCSNANFPIATIIGPEGLLLMVDMLASAVIISTREFIAKNLFNTVPLCPMIWGIYLKIAISQTSLFGF